MCHDTYPPRIFLDVFPAVVDSVEQRNEELNCQLTLVGTMDTEDVTLQMNTPPLIQGIACTFV